MSEQNTVDPWTTETGLLSDYEGTCVDAWFTTDPKVQNGTILLFCMKLTTDQPDTPENEERWSCGPDWASYDGGNTAEHPKGDAKRFNQNSQYGKLINRVVEIGAGPDIAQRGTPRNAKVWIGTKWYFETKTDHVSFTDKEGNKVERDSSRNFPTKFLGLVDFPQQGQPQGQQPAPTSQQQPAQTPPPVGSPAAAPSPTAQAPVSTGDAASATTGAASDGPLSALDPANAAKAKVLAKSLPYAEWVDKVMEIPGVVENDNLIMAIADESGLYTTLHNG
jgi:hypothetical protein